MNKNKWMESLLPNTPLRNINVPGSHDAGTWDIHACSPWNQARDDLASKFAKIARYTTPCTTVNYSKVQNLDLVDQFREGVRYFDLRVAKHIQDSKIQYRFTHGLLGGSFLEGMKDLIEYSEKYPKEILICDIRFIYGFEKKDHEVFQNDLVKMIGNRLANSDVLNASSKLKKFWDLNKNIIVIYHSFTKYRFPHFWSPNTVTSLWPNTTNTDLAVQKMDDYINNLKTSNRWDKNPNTFYGLHATLTPDNLYVATHLWWSTKKLARNLNKKMVDLFKNEWKDAKLSFVMYDVVEYPELAETIIKTNFT